jgi:hypothetical protein
MRSWKKHEVLKKGKGKGKALEKRKGKGKEKKGHKWGDSSKRAK